MFRICRVFHFSASHQLRDLAEGHPCGRVHGHNWTVEIILEGEQVDSRGFLRDFGDLEPIRRAIEEEFEHRHLNDVLPINPTSENVAHWLFSRWKPHFPEMTAIRVSETSDAWAEYRG